MAETTTVVITGGAGFAGSCLAVYLRKELNYDVYCFDNLKRRGSETNLQKLKACGAKFVHGDIRSKEDFLELPRKVHFMVEASAEPSVLAGTGGASIDYLVNTNLVGSLNCFSYAKEVGAKIIFLSTSRVYPIHHLCGVTYTEGATRFDLGAEQPLPGMSAQGVAESFPMDGARSLYGTTKLASEMFLPEYKEFMDVSYVINRFGVLAGPGQFGKIDQGVTVLWVARHYFRRQLSYIGFNGTGKQVRDALHIDDFCSAIAWQMQNFDKVDGQLFNIGGGRDCSFSLLELTGLCEKATGNKIDIKPVRENRTADIPIYITDSSKFMQATGWKPAKTPEDIVVDIYKWIKENEELLTPILNP